MTNDNLPPETIRELRKRMPLWSVSLDKMVVYNGGWAPGWLVLTIAPKAEGAQDVEISIAHKTDRPSRRRAIRAAFSAACAWGYKHKDKP